MAENFFRFKQFSVKQDASAHRVGTDGVLLGTIADGFDRKPARILDIGTGTGLIALILAQRFPNAEIDAIEIEEKAFEEAVQNFENSPWSDRLFCYHAGFQEFVEEMDEEYDLIVCNPPFFRENENKITHTPRNIARNETFLPLRELTEGVPNLLSPDGAFWAIGPPDYISDMMTEISGFKPFRHIQVKGTKVAEVKRIVAGLTRNGLMSLKAKDDNNPYPINTTMVLEKSRHQYTEEFGDLTKDFYL